MGWFGFSKKVDPSISTPANLLGQTVGYSQSAAAMGSKARKLYFKDVARQWGGALFRRITGRKHAIRSVEGESGRFLMFRRGDPAAIRLDLVGKLSGIKAGESKASGAPEESASTVPGAVAATAHSIAEVADQKPPHEVLLERLLARSTGSASAAEIVEDIRQLNDPTIADNLDPSLIAQLREQLTLQLLEVKLPECQQVFFPAEIPIASLGIDFFEDIDIPIEERESKLLAMGGTLRSADPVDAPDYSEDSDLAESRRLVDREMALAQGVRNLQNKYGHGTDNSVPTAALHPAAFLSDLAERLARLTGGNKRVPAELLERLFDQARLMGSRAESSTKGRVLLPGDALWSLQYLVSSLDDPAYDPVSDKHSALSGASNDDQRAMERLEGFATYLDGLIGADGHLDEARLNLVKAAAKNDNEKAYAEARHELHKAVRSLGRLFGGINRADGKSEMSLSPFFAGGRVKFDSLFLGRQESNKALAGNMREVNLLLANVMLLQWKAERLRCGESPELDLTANPGNLHEVFSEGDLKGFGFADEVIEALRDKDDSKRWKDHAQELADTVVKLASLGLSASGEVGGLGKVVEQARAKLFSNRDLSLLTGNAAKAEAIATLVDRDSMARAERLRGLPDPDSAGAQTRAYDLAASRISDAYDRLSALTARCQLASSHLDAHAKAHPGATLRADHAPTIRFATELAVFRDLHERLRAMNDLEGTLQKSLLEEDSEGLALDLAACRGVIAELKIAAAASLGKLTTASDTPLHAMVFPRGEGRTAEDLLARLAQGNDPDPGNLADSIHTLATAPSQEKLYRAEILENARVQTRLLETRQGQLSKEQRRDLRMALAGAAARCLMESRQADLPAGNETPVSLWSQRERFTEVLAASGLDIQAFAPEIEDMLLREINVDTLEKWLDEAGKLPPPSDPQAGSIHNAARAVLVGAIPSMKDGDRFFLKSNGTVEMGLNGFPVGLSGLKIDAAASRGRRNVLVIQRKPNSLVVNVRSGNTGGMRLGVGMGWFKSPAIKASAKAQLNKSNVAGYAIEIPWQDDKPQEFVRLLMGGQPIGARDLALHAKEIKALTKSEIKASLDVSAGLGYAPGAKDAIVGVSIGANVGVGASRAWASATQANSKVETFKIAKSYAMQVSPSAGVTVKSRSALGVMADQVLEKDSPYAGTLATSGAQLVGTQVTLARTREAELSVQRLARDGSLLKAEYEFVIPLAAGMTRSDLESIDSTLKAQLSSLSDEQRAGIDAMLAKVDSQDGHVLIISSQMDSARVKNLNTQFAREVADARANRVLGREVSNAQMQKALGKHQQRLENLGNEAAGFKLQRFILAKGDSMTRNQGLNLGLTRFALQKQAGVGTTVEVLELAAPPVSVKPAEIPQEARPDFQRQEQAQAFDFWNGRATIVPGSDSEAEGGGEKVDIAEEIRRGVHEN